MEDYYIRHIDSNPSLEGLAKTRIGVTFSHAGGTEVRMRLITPQNLGKKYPLLVFLQGSGWTCPGLDYETPQLCELARRGYVVAMITHRNCMKEGVPYNAFILDAKCAVRHLRANAEEYHIDPDRVGFWGTSSGGNTALLMALTGDDPKFKTDEYPEYSDSVKFAIDCFGPSDMRQQLFENRKSVFPLSEKSVFYYMVGPDGAELSRLDELSPILMLKGQPVPPILLIHGDKDVAVSYSQSENMYRALKDNGYTADMICVDGAPHEGSFWSRELFEIIFDYIEKHI